ncbi:hypothetical protein [Desertivibrio insolitus]|uniref:hypothetical protein n=1 Tax=Herbiconiux sp. SYSU D00978 TaxID=2812562 RepID=UPI001A970A31|nr:hypothetical protein [Herbiconiux sp. SYSU D00978]
MADDFDPSLLSPAELRLHIAQTREGVERSVEELKGRLDFRAHYYRALATWKRDYGTNPTAFLATAAGIGLMGLFVVGALVFDRDGNDDE